MPLKKKTRLILIVVGVLLLIGLPIGLFVGFNNNSNNNTNESESESQSESESESESQTISVSNVYSTSTLKLCGDDITSSCFSQDLVNEYCQYSEEEVECIFTNQPNAELTITQSDGEITCSFVDDEVNEALSTC